MGKRHFILPNPPSLKEKDIEKFKNIDTNDFENSNAYKKYIQPAIERRKQLKANSRKKWWKDNWLNVATFIVSILTLIATILFGIIQLIQ